MRQSTLALMLLTVAIGVGLFLVKYRVQSLEDQLQILNRGIAGDREKIHVLKAEWSYFNEPERLRTLAGRHLDMMPVQSGQVMMRQRLEENLPERRPEPTAEPTTDPITKPSDQLAAESGDNAGKEFRP